MGEIKVVPAGERRFDVEVNDESSSSRHDVTVEQSTLDQLGVGEGDAPELVRRSFEFLLEREPKESILSSFELSVIGRYFPEYPDEIRRRLD